MANDFQKTVNLKEKGQTARFKEIDKTFKGDNSEFQKISLPKEQRISEPLIKRAVIFVAVILVAATIYLLLFAKGEDKATLEKTSNWYAVKLVDGEIFYGQIGNTASDPIVIKNVYYNYDQEKGETKDAKDSTSLRLVKRGEETHGPDGTMDIVRSQILYMESLKKESKVLDAILSYEK